MNIKKLFPEKRISKKGLLEFLDKKGFYIVLILCIAIVGATAVFVTTHNITSSNTEFDNKLIPEEPEKAAVEEKKVAESSVNTNAAPVQKAQQKGPEANKPASPSNAPKQPAVKNTAPKAAAPKAKTASTGSTAVKNQKFIMPVFGPVTYEYADNKLLYSKTLEEWRTHSGLDLGGEKGTPVKVTADGVVSEIKNDPRYGIIVVVDHQNGIKTVYANLASDEMVNPNQKLKQGDIIGSIGNTASFESIEQPHLHFEVWKNNEPINPAEYLPKQ